MPDTTFRRIVLVAAIAGAIVGGAVASGVAEASSGHGGGNANGARNSSGDAASVKTAKVTRTDLVSTVQVGGSIGFQGSYSVQAPSGTNAQQVAQSQQALQQAQDALAADETSETDTTAADDQAVTAAQDASNHSASALAADQSAEASACGGHGASTPVCAQDTQKVTQDQAQLSQAQQQLSSAEANATRDRDQSQAKIQADRLQLQGARAALSSAQSNAVNPGTTYTSLPKVGDVVRQGQPLYSVDGLPVLLLYGSVSAYRSFRAGMADGPDVGELNQDLIDLGYGAGLTPSEHFSSATAAALQRWQAALGQPATGTVLLGEVVFEPGPIRVTSVSPSVGQTVTPGNVLDATSTTPVVTVDLDVTQEYLLEPGDPVTVELPDGVTSVRGKVLSVGNVAVCPNGNGQGAGNGTPGGGGSADQTPCSAAGSGSSSTPTVTVTITLDSTPPGATLDQAPVNVNITTQRADHVLAVPVNALLALQGGGDAVEVVSRSGNHLVAVTTGLYSNTLVQISGEGITDGTLVEVPAS